MTKLNLKNTVILIMPLFVMSAIFFFSAQNAETSTVTSSSFSKIFARILFFNFEMLSIETKEIVAIELDGFIRKTAHFAIYSLLGLSVFFSARIIFKTLKIKIFMSVIFCFLYAVSDEIHQNFVPGRSGNIKDVFIDTCGSLCGIIVAIIAASVFFCLKYNKKWL